MRDFIRFFQSELKIGVKFVKKDLSLILAGVNNDQMFTTG